jgi:hypothetical protein
MPPSSLRWSNPSTTTLEIPLLTRYVSGVGHVVARVELGRQDGWKSIGSGEGKELSVLTAFINGRVRPQGIRLVSLKILPNEHRSVSRQRSRLKVSIAVWHYRLRIISRGILFGFGHVPCPRPSMALH